MSHHISKTDSKRWFCVETSVDVIHVFGHASLGSILDTGQPNMQTYLLETELELHVNSVLGPDYYKDAVESSSDLFMGESGKYPT
jgi:hypothetical protein